MIHLEPNKEFKKTIFDFAHILSDVSPDEVVFVPVGIIILTRINRF